jgi:hypothetical protein
VNFVILPICHPLAGLEKRSHSRPLSVHPESSVADPSPSARLDGSQVITGEIVSQFFIGGVADAYYVLTYLITFSDSSVEAFDAVISVRPFIGL